MADTAFNTSAPIDILLGSEHVWSTLTGKRIYDNTGNLIAISSVFGWVITSLMFNQSNQAISLTTTTDINATLQRFWELENVGNITKTGT